MIRQLILSLILALRYWYRARRAEQAENRAKRLQHEAHVAAVAAKFREIEMLEIKARMRRITTPKGA